ncbi:MAG: hypothetical protein ACOCZU_03385 [Planctomycetota bacterium]
MNDLDTIRTHVDFLLERARRSDLSDEERQQISAEVNQLWTKLASMSHTQSNATASPEPTSEAGQSNESEDSDNTVRFVM